MPSLRAQFPLRLIIGNDDVTFLLDEGATFSSVDPGGYEMASFQVPRDLPQVIRGLPVRIDCGLRVAWEGRVSQIQRSLGNRTTITCEGYGALLKDTAASMVFIDRDLTRWVGPSVARQIALATATNNLGSSQAGSDTKGGKQALVQTVTGAWVATTVQTCEAYYDSGPANKVDYMYVDLTSSNADGGNMPAGVGWHARVCGITDDQAGGLAVISSPAELITGAEQAGYTSSANTRYALLNLYYNGGAGGTENALYQAYWHNVAVYGTHGLALAPGSDPKGFYPSTIVGWAAGQAPGLALGVTQATDATGYVIPHSVYYTPVPLSQIVNDMAVAGGWHWGVWEALAPLTGNPTPRLDFRPRPTLGQFSAFCVRGQCDQLDVREDLTNQYDTAQVSYTDVAGVQGSVTVTVDNPILDAAGIHQAVQLNGGLMTPAAASTFGQAALALVNNQGRVAGTVQISQAIDGPSGPTAAWLLKPGIDRLRVGDLPSTDAFGAYNDLPLTRMECAITAQGIITTLEVGTGGNLVETLQSRLTAAATLAGQGGV